MYSHPITQTRLVLYGPHAFSLVYSWDMDRHGDWDRDRTAKIEVADNATNS